MTADFNLSPHFKLSELVRSEKAIELQIDNMPRDETIINNLRIVCCRILEPVRDHFGPFTPNSGYRTPQLNQLVRGSVISQHIFGQAVDCEIPGVSNYDLAKWIAVNLTYDQLILEHYTRGVPNSGWVHCSIKSGQNRMQILTITKEGERLDGLHE